MKVSELGEFALIDRLAGVLAEHGIADTAGRLAVDIGDDAAVWRADGHAIVATTDTLVAGVHFLPDQTPWRDLGWKTMAVNVSDIAAMGGTPEFAIVTLALLEQTDVEELDDLYRGLAEAGEAYGVAIAGGDIVRSPVFALTVALCGRADVDESGEPLVLRRDAAQPGDVVAVTGALGGATGGLRALREGREQTESVRLLIERHLHPEARVEAGHAAVEAGLRCAIDVSDGLLQDLGHICQRSRLGAVVWRDQVPIDPMLSGLFAPEEALRYAVAGGEDYELVLVGPAAQIEAAREYAGVPVTIIGEMVIQAEPAAALLDEAGREVEVPGGWNHLSGQA